jgi:hypothetical protein
VKNDKKSKSERIPDWIKYVQLATMPNYFTNKDVSNITGVSLRNIIYYAERGLIAPSVQNSGGSGTLRLWDFFDLYCFHILKHLRDSGIETHSIEEIILFIRRKQILKHLLLIISNEMAILKTFKPDYSMIGVPDIFDEVSPIKKYENLFPDELGGNKKPECIPGFIFILQNILERTPSIQPFDYSKFDCFRNKRILGLKLNLMDGHSLHYQLEFEDYLIKEEPGIVTIKIDLFYALLSLFSIYLSRGAKDFDSRLFKRIFGKDKSKIFMEYLQDARTAKPQELMAKLKFIEEEVRKSEIE